MKEKDFENMLDQEPDRFRRGKMHEAWRDYRYALTPTSEISEPVFSGAACSLIVTSWVGIYLGNTLSNSGTAVALSFAGCAVGISILLFLNHKLKKWRMAKEKEFRQNHPLAHLLFPSDLQHSADIGVIVKIYD